ncbi:OprO/OprP family phosphate-selective porin [Nitrospina watsonii]|uniref:Phosphate-selective porin n=1 Tax=Nitrospina watsonii TaxID=1323948 RepID=A0ABM9HFF1_9BACT|nr:porin [Nitrospina watsonii]CAI2718976.1 Putative Phosphate-selective porin [Nitrospina watsonii]
MIRLGVALLAVIGMLVPAHLALAEPSDTEDRLRALEEKLKRFENLENLPQREDYIQVQYKNPGFEMKTADGLFSTKLVWRAQLRYTTPHRSDPRSVSDFTTRSDASNFEARRLRMKIGGHGFKPWIDYYFEIDLQPSRDVDDNSAASSARVIDYRITLQPYDELGIRVGQWKIDYNRERVDSSGRQQFVERSIVNRVFTIDRQVGVQVRGRLFKETYADMRYYAGVFNGEGRSVNNPDNDMMYMGRLQWNFLGRDLKWRQSDVAYHKKPTGSLAFAAATNNGKCSRWSSSGCGNLSGLTRAGSTSQNFKVEQYVQEFAFKYRGLSIQEEFHWKDVEDKRNMTTHKYKGMYAQAGYFFHGLIPQIPEKLELAARYAFVDAPVATNVALTDKREEYTVALNYFFSGHDNKITVDYSMLELEDASTGISYDDSRVRVQWDVSF